MINRELYFVARDRIELPTQGFSVALNNTFFVNKFNLIYNIKLNREQFQN